MPSVPSKLDRSPLALNGRPLVALAATRQWWRDQSVLNSKKGRPARPGLLALALIAGAAPGSPSGTGCWPPAPVSALEVHREYVPAPERRPDRWTAPPPAKRHLTKVVTTMQWT